MISLSAKLGPNYVAALSGFHKFRKFSDGITFFSFSSELDLYRADHKPSFQIHLALFNFMLLEFEICNRHHQEF